MTNIDIPSSLVDKYRIMDPETEDLLFDGFELRPGMVILTAHAGSLYDLAEETDPQKILARDTMNRWARVIKVSSVDSQGFIHFSCEYADGVKTKRHIGYQMSWLVKKDSVPGAKKTDVGASIVKDLAEIIEKALLAQDSATYHGRAIEDGPVVDEIVQKILPVFDREQLLDSRNYKPLSNQLSSRLKMKLLPMLLEVDVDKLNDIVDTIVDGDILTTVKEFNGDI